jgi:uncharacterized protein with NRDE domain
MNEKLLDAQSFRLIGFGQSATGDSDRHTNARFADNRDMCIAAFGFGSTPGYRLAFVANRDELHSRPTAKADWWEEAPDLLGGRDLTAGGSWLAIDRRGRLAAVTNLPQATPKQFPRSRGALVSGFLTNDDSAADFAAEFAANADQFGPCNLLVWDGDELHYATTGASSAQIEPGIHALANAPLGADWPRVHRAEQGLRDALNAEDTEMQLLSFLANGEAGDAEDSDAALARRRTEIFVHHPRYGTRSSTVVLITDDGNVVFTERSYASDAAPTGLERYTFSIENV